MKKILVSLLLVFLGGIAVQAADLDPAYRKAFGEGVVIATNGDYPPVAACNPGQFNLVNGEFHVKLGTPISFRAISPAGKKWKNFMDQVLKEKGGNLKYKQDGVFYWQIWTDRDESNNLLDAAKNPWPKAGKEPNWGEAAWFSTDWKGDEAGTWDTVGINADAFMENINRVTFSAQQGQKFYIALYIGYSYMTPGGQMEQKWNSNLNRFESVESSGELGYMLSDLVCAGTFVIDGAKEEASE